MPHNDDMDEFAPHIAHNDEDQVAKAIEESLRNCGGQMSDDEIYNQIIAKSQSDF